MQKLRLEEEPNFKAPISKQPYMKRDLAFCTDFYGLGGVGARAAEARKSSKVSRSPKKKVPTRGLGGAPCDPWRISLW